MSEAAAADIKGHAKPAVAGQVKNLPPQPAATIAGDRKTVAWSALVRSPHNPRKRFDDEKVAQLAESIAAEGILQNLVVRPDGNKPGSFEIAIGETRHRAVERLIKQKRCDVDYPMPVEVRKLTNAQLIEIALAENMQRKDLTPIEEAEALKKLRDNGLTTADIAAKIGFTQRYVQQRLALVENLAPEAKALLEKGDIKVETARILASAPKDRQTKILEDIGPGKYGQGGYDEHPDDLRELVKDHQIPEKHAIFDLALYKGEWLPSEKDGERFFADTVQFLKLQKAAVTAKRKLIEEKGDAAWVSIGKYTSWNYDKKPGHKKAGVFIELADDGKVTIHKDLVEKPKPTYGSSYSTPAKAPEPEKLGPEAEFAGAHLEHAEIRKTHALQRAIAESPHDAMRIILAGCLGSGWGADAISPVETFTCGQAGVDGQVVDDLKAQLGRIEGLGNVKVSAEGGVAHGGSNQLQRFQALCKVTDAQIEKLFARVIAAHFALSDDCYNTKPGDREGALALAAHFKMEGKEEKHGLALSEADVEKLGDKAIRAVARELKIERWQLGSIPFLKGETAAAIKAGKAKSFVLPTLRFSKDPKKEIDALVKCVLDAAPAKAETKAEPKAKKKGKK